MNVKPFRWALIVGLLTLVSGCRRVSPGAKPLLPALTGRTTPLSSFQLNTSAPGALAEALSVRAGSARLSTMVVEAQMKRVMGRSTSLRDVVRVVSEDGPIIEEAARQPEVQPALQQIARDSNTSLDAARERWQRLQEADILLESGGNPDDVSAAHAVGVAQWILETGRRAGLRVDKAASDRLSAQIEPLEREATWMEYLTHPDADRATPGAPSLAPEAARQRLAVVLPEIVALKEQRKTADPRYDPKPSLFAHARYLLGLYHRFPSLDWVFQAFHGGESGVQKTLHKYVGAAWPGSTAAAIRSGGPGRLTFERAYFGATPRAHDAAFLYLYGRLDDHRYYWWKLRAAEQAIGLYRRSPALFKQTWEAFLPGRPKETFWYPEAPRLGFRDDRAASGALSAGQLLPLSASSLYRLNPLLSNSASALLRPEAKGALLLTAEIFRVAGGKSLTIGDLLVPADKRMRSASPSPAPQGPPGPPVIKPLTGGGPPDDFDFHSTGLAFDLLKPSDTRQRKITEFALSWLCDRHALWWREEPDAAGAHYHAVPNPRYAAELGAIGRTGRLPRMAALD